MFNCWNGTMKINIRLVTLIVAIALSATPCEVLAKCRGSNLIGSYSSTSNTNDSFYLQSDSDEAMDNAIDNSGALVKAFLKRNIIIFLVNIFGRNDYFGTDS